jgi:hypothetical protein
MDIDNDSSHYGGGAPSAGRASGTSGTAVAPRTITISSCGPTSRSFSWISGTAPLVTGVACVLALAPFECGDVGAGAVDLVRHRDVFCENALELNRDEREHARDAGDERNTPRQA